MNIDIERKLFHTWDYKSGVCRDCGASDAVSLCCHHPEGCDCKNPPCPATHEEIASIVKKHYDITQKQGADVTTTATAVPPPTYRSPTQPFSITVHDIFNRMLKELPGRAQLQQQDGKVNLVYAIYGDIDYQPATATHIVAVKLQCTGHGVSILRVTFTDLLGRDGYLTQLREYVFNNMYCPTCRADYIQF
jgi:hypothetical protein